MSRTRRTIGLSVFVMLVVLGTGWALEKKASSSSQKQGGAAVTEPAKASEPSDESPEVKPAATDSNQEYDRSDLLLSQG